MFRLPPISHQQYVSAAKNWLRLALLLLLPERHCQAEDWGPGRPGSPNHPVKEKSDNFSQTHFHMPLPFASASLKIPVWSHWEQMSSIGSSLFLLLPTPMPSWPGRSDNMQNSRNGNIWGIFGPHAGRADVRPAFVKGLSSGRSCLVNLSWWRCVTWNTLEQWKRILICKNEQQMLPQKLENLFSFQDKAQNILISSGSQFSKCPNFLTDTPFGGKVSASWAGLRNSGRKLELFDRDKLSTFSPVAALKRLFWLCPGLTSLAAERSCLSLWCS